MPGSTVEWLLDGSGNPKHSSLAAARETSSNAADGSPPFCILTK
jgi:hypothetical protein